jgi:hypothetical protein
MELEQQAEALTQLAACYRQWASLTDNAQERAFRTRLARRLLARAADLVPRRVGAR